MSKLTIIYKELLTSSIPVRVQLFLLLLCTLTLGWDNVLHATPDNSSINFLQQEEKDSIKEQKIEEIVMIGYGKQKRNDVTGAVSVIKADDITKLPTTSPEQALQGQAAGVTVVNGGSPGSAPAVRIRGVGTLGDNSPWYVVDGILTKDISDLNPSDIESFSVLKDAATAAAYGSVGANGIIVVTTKKGRKGRTQFNFDTYYGTQFIPKKLDLLNASQYVAYATEMNENAGVAVPTRLTDATYADYITNNTDWQDAIFRTAPIENYSFGASGGGENSTFRLSAGYQKQDGIIINSDFEKFTFRANGEIKKGKFTIGENFALAFTNQSQMINANSITPIEYAIKMAPYLPIYNSSHLGGFQGPEQIDGQDARNPVRALTLETIKNNGINALGNIYGSYEILNGLTYKAVLGINYNDNKVNDISNPYYDSDQQYQDAKQVTKLNTTEKWVTFTNSLNYVKQLGGHSFDILALAEKTKRDLDIISATGSTEYDINELPSTSLAYSYSYPYAKIGYLGRLNYEYMGKYLLTLSIRRDGSSRFGNNYKWGNFPAVSAGWVLSKENFFNTGFMNYAKIRGSWGKTGNDNAADFAFASVLYPNYYYGDNVIGLAATSLANPNLKWEETTSTNVGIDLAFLSNALTFTAEYYENKSDDLLIQVPAAASVGVPSSTWTNVGGMKTNGFEFDLGYRNYKKDFRWSANFNLSTTKNKVTKLASNVTDLYTGAKPNIFGGGTISRVTVGEALWHYYGWVTDGIFQSQDEIDSHATQSGAEIGDIRFKDLNGDGIIDNNDRTVLGDFFPDITYGLSFNCEYKNFDFGFLISGVSGNEIYNANGFYLYGADRIFNASTEVLNRWTTSNPSSTQPRAVTGDPNGNTRVSDRYVEDGSYMRLKNLSLGYSFSNSMLETISNGVLSKFRIYVSAQNIFTITDYSGYDPELAPASGAISTTGDTNSEMGIDRGQYPQPKSFIFGLQVTF